MKAKLILQTKFRGIFFICKSLLELSSLVLPKLVM